MHTLLPKSTVAIFCTLFLTFAFSNSRGQDTSTALQDAERLFLLGKAHESKETYDSAIFYYQRSLETDSSLSKRLGHIYFGLGNCAYYFQGGDLPKSIAYYLKALEVLKQVYPPTHDSLSLTHNYLVYNYNELGKFELQQKHLLENLRIDSISYAQNKDSAYAEKLANGYTNMGVYFGNIGNMNAQLEYYKKGLDYMLLSGRKDTLSIFYNNVATGYWYLGDVQKALEYIDQALEVELQFSPDSVSHIMVTILNNLSVIQQSEGRKQDYIQTLYQAQKILMKLPTDPRKRNLLGTIYSNLAFVYIGLKQADSVKKYNELGMQMAEKIKSEYHRFKFIVNQSGLHFILKDYQKSISWSEKAVSMFKANYGEHHPELAQAFINQAQCYRFLGEQKKAIQFYEKAIQSNQNPQLKENEFRPILTLSAMTGIGRSLYLLYKQEGEKEYLEKARAIFTEINKRNLELRKSYLSPSARLALQSRLNQSYESAIQISGQLYQLSGDQTYLEDIYRYMQTQKALNLYEHLQDRYAISYAGIPDSLIAYEKNLRQDISSSMQMINAFSTSGYGNPKVINRLNAERLNLEDKYEGFISKLERDYPAYYQLKYSKTFLNINQAKQLLTEENEGIIEYFVGDSISFSLGIFNDSVYFHSFESIGLSQQVSAWRKSILQGLADNCESIGFDLYKKLLAPIVAHRKSGPLVIIPAGILHHLPFEALVSQQNEGLSRFGELAYLVHDFPISYAVSSNLLASGLNANPIIGSRGILAMAPVFDKDYISSYQTGTGSSQYPLYKLISQEHSFGLLSDLLSIFKGHPFFG